MDSVKISRDGVELTLSMSENAEVRWTEIVPMFVSALDAQGFSVCSFDWDHQNRFVNKTPEDDDR